MLNLAELDGFLREGGVLLVPNHHGAQQWQDALGRWRCQQLNTTVVEAPTIYAVDLWLAQLWQDLGLHCDAAELGWRQLGAAEEELLWQQQLDGYTDTPLLNTAGTARELRDAAALLQLWQVSPGELRRYLPAGASGPLVDSAIAARWLQDFDQRCRQHQWMSGTAWLTHLVRLLREHPGLAGTLLPRRLLWLGFDDSPPLYVELQNTLAALGITLQHDHQIQTPTHQSVRAYADSANELRAAATWCAEVLADTPLARIGIICPNLYSVEPQLLRIFRQHLPAQELYCSVTSTLATQPFFNAALQLLSLTDSTCDSNTVCRLLRSPWLRGADSEQDARTALELRLRRQGELQTQTAYLRDSSSHTDKPWHCPLLCKALLDMHTLSLRFRKPQSLAAWLTVFEHHWQLLLNLDLLSAPQHRALTGAWQRWLDAAVATSSLLGSLTRQQAAAALQTLARSTPLPPTRGNAAVRILTPVEAAGLGFTHLWVLQLHAEAWPAELHPNPLLPLRLQRERAMPAANAQLELQRAQRQWQQWQQACSETLVLSYPAQVDDLPVEPAALLRELPVAVITSGDLPAALHQSLAAFPPRQLTLHIDEELLPPAGDQVHGPGSLLTAQALCPFKAFATYRLGARELPAFRLGLQASVVGELLHKVLQQFWLAVRDSASLANDELTDVSLRQALDDNLKQLTKRYPFTLTPRFRLLEQQRLLALLERWLDIERQRRPFRVLMTEGELQWQWQQLQLTVRLDRVDRGEHGLLIVDYKTGKTANVDWQSERPRDPQLWLYHAALQQKLPDETVAGLLHAKINLDDLDYSGITAGDEGFDQLPFAAHKKVTAADWNALQQHWQHVLAGLAQEYLQGLVAVVPQFTNSCQYCHLPALCRIDERRRLESAS